MTDDNEQMTERELGDTFITFVEQARHRLTEKAGGEIAARTIVEQYADVQVDALTAIYHELRHGNDQRAEHAEALRAHTKALKTNTEVMGELAAQLLGNSDALSRSRR